MNHEFETARRATPTSVLRGTAPYFSLMLFDVEHGKHSTGFPH
jgi:hypothetical protein